MDISDFYLELNYFIDNSMKPVEGPEEDELFCKMEDYNYFESREECELWARKINALHKLRLIANHLNGGSEKCNFAIVKENGKISVADVYIISGACDIAFRSKELAEKAIDMMGEKSMEDLFA